MSKIYSKILLELKDKNKVEKTIRWTLHNVCVRSVPKLFLKAVLVHSDFKNVYLI